jgi:uncharacterized protein (TIGR00725 family)
VKGSGGPRRRELRGGSVEGHSLPSERNRQVTVIGSSRLEAGSELEALAEGVGRRLAQAGVTLVCGAGSGVMEAAARGAAEAGGRVIGIVQGESIAAANPYCTEVVASGIGHARNLAVVASGEVVIAVGGEWGTLSEIGLARTIGRPVVALRSWELNGCERMRGAPGVVATGTAEEAVAAALAKL